MTTQDEIAAESSTRAYVAAKIRGMLAERRISINSIPGRLGRESSKYWYRRLTTLDTALDLDDLSDLARMLNVDVVEFFGVAPQGPPRGGGSTRGKRSPSYVDGLRLLQSVPDDEPAVIQSDAA